MRALLLVILVLTGCGDDDDVADAAADAAANASPDAANAPDADATSADAASADADAMLDGADAMLDGGYPPVPEGLECELTRANAVPGVCNFGGDCGPNEYEITCSEAEGTCACKVNEAEVGNFPIPRSDYCSIDPATEPASMQLYLYECGFPRAPAETCGVDEISAVPGACTFEGMCNGDTHEIVCQQGGPTCECFTNDVSTRVIDFAGSCAGAGGVDAPNYWITECDFPWSSE